MLSVLDAEATAKLARVQTALEDLYGLEPGPNVSEFVEWVDDGSWETLFVQEVREALEIRLRLPVSAQSAPPSANDPYLQLVEGVSHFVLVAERARVELPTTLLELELQAEVDKFALLLEVGSYSDAVSLRELHHYLYERVAFLHAHGTAEGKRYRTANTLAAKLWARFVRSGDTAGSRDLLRRFYRSGQNEKIRLALAA